ncbi:hypothetical protein ENU1_093140 [Entamoeba nuttalli P19]|uniref:Uncharacterized protein n=1 Tax=Entamoeba nuttalli (strain P19) TaxID=1076696 RepID=K2HCA3_ENTNP|nr:hypothetical protein ENU1_093140 [Entamoeba nuttalli P19]EKE40349.1 hypothetical protein ENU1_093140 [Entamoeba nuttalli P19]|eukprot:XP_008857315.1 hypothetical protein ENU1_093140 [Entamoeba nuttalli P19]
MSKIGRVHDDIYYEVAGMDIMDVYTESREEPAVNSLLKKFYYCMKDPQYCDWRLRDDARVDSDELRQDIIRNKLESIRRCERISRFMDENGININSFNTWNKKFAKKVARAVNQTSIPDWVRKNSKKCDDVTTDERVVADEIIENDAKRSMLKPVKRGDEEKKPKNPETKDN